MTKVKLQNHTDHKLSLSVIPFKQQNLEQKKFNISHQIDFNNSRKHKYLAKKIILVSLINHFKMFSFRLKITS